MFLERPGLLGVTGPPRTGVAVVRQGRGVGLGQGPGPRRRSEPVKAAPSGLHRLSPGGRLHNKRSKSALLDRYAERNTHN